MRQFIVSAWRSGLRGRSFQVVFILGVLLVGVAYLAASFSPRQPKTVALDVGLSGLRFGLVLLTLFWVQELVGKEVERRTVVFALTYPVPRASYVIGRFLGILLLSAVAAVILGLLLLLAVLFAGGEYQQQFPVDLGVAYWATIIAIWLDVAVVTAFTLMISTLSTVPMLPLALGAAFAIAGRAFGAVRDYIVSGADGDKALATTFHPLLDAVGWVLPDLSRLDWRPWPMYRMALDVPLIGWSIAMALGYAAIMLVLAVIAFQRREFA